ncbi:MAG: hypothetical protein GY927_23820 [bacterium]|nr:hypothetical protein [bacterium]
MSKNNHISTFCAVILATCMSFQNGEANAEEITAGSVLEKMETKELGAYLTGLIDGFAHARYLKDGKNQNGGMKCIYSWYYGNNDAANQIIFAFDKYKKHRPNTVVAAMLKQQCGE